MEMKRGSTRGRGRPRKSDMTHSTTEANEPIVDNFDENLDSGPVHFEQEEAPDFSSQHGFHTSTEQELQTAPIPLVPISIKQPPYWRKKLRTGDHIMPDDRVITGTQVVQAWADELGGGIDKFDQITGDGPYSTPFLKSTLRIEARTDGMYDVVDEKNVTFNTTPLTKEEAESLMNGV